MPSKLDPHNEYLQERWEAGCHNRLQLWREIQKQGFKGSHQSVYFWAKHRGLPKESKPKLPKKQAAKKISPSKARP